MENIHASGEDFEIITQKEFEEAWEKHCNNYKEEWVLSKDTFKIGMQVMGEVEILYPHGVVIKLDKNTIAIVDYKDCLNNLSITSLYPHQNVIGKVKGYDEINMWIVLEETRIII